MEQRARNSMTDRAGEKKRSMAGTDADPHRYDDMLEMPHHVSPTRPRMALSERAAQFLPFAALSGYEERLQEVERRNQTENL